MSNDENYFNPYENKSSNLSIKQLYKDDDTGKIIITDYNNNKIESDMFGRKIKYFLPKITGILSGSNRKKINKIKFINYSASPSNYNILEQNDENKFHRKKTINYRPAINRLDGFNCFPRPISLPFYNIPEYDIKNNLRNEINKEAIKYYNDENKYKNKENNNKKPLSYLTNDLNEYNIGEKDKDKILNLIDNNIKEIKEEYKMKLNVVGRNPNYIALNQFKKRILLSKKNEIKYDEAPNEIKNQYKIMQNVIKNKISLTSRNNNLINKKEKKFFNRNLNKIINKYYRLKGKSSSSIELVKEKSNKKINFFNKNNNDKNIIIGPDKLNNLFRSKDFSIGRSIKMDFGNFSYEGEEKKPVKNNINYINVNIEDNKSNDSMNILPKTSNNLISKKNSKENIFYQDKDTAETVSNMNRNNTEIRIIDERIEDDELSFISRENETENINNKKKKTNIRTLKFMNKNFQLEKELLEGIKTETPREEVEIPHPRRKIILKNEGQLYRENLALLKLTNPEKYKLLEQKEEYDKKLLIKKLENSRKQLDNKFK